MTKNELSKIDSQLSELSLGIKETDSALEKFSKKLIGKIIKKCVQDRSGAAFYQTARVLINLVPHEGEKELISLMNDGVLMNNNKALKQVYKCCEQILSNTPELSEKLIPVIIKRANQKENDAENIAQIFSLCEKISQIKPEYASDMKNIKERALTNLSTNNPEQSMMFISSMLSSNYPSKENLAAFYAAFSTMLSSSKLKKEAYVPMVNLLEECAKSGYNQGKNAQILNNICNEIAQRAPQFNAQIVRIKKQILDNKKGNYKNADKSKTTATGKTKANTGMSRVAVQRRARELD